MFEYGSVEGLFYVCEAYMLCLSLNVLKFFGKLLHPNDDPIQDLRFFLVMQASIKYFFMLNDMKNGGLHLDPTRFFHQPQQSFIS